MPSFTVYKGSKDGIKKSSTNKPELKGDQVHLKVTASGVCGTDLHYREGDMVLGHEGVGVVEATGPEVKFLKKGDRVGWGYEHDSCGHCNECLTGNEIYCPERKMYAEADLDQGSFAEGAVWREAFLFKIPDDLSDEVAAPLQCGGATVFSALYSYGVQPTDCVGVMGVGGLGHLAIQFAAKMGCHVTVLSGSDKKKDEAMKLGAREFIAMKDAKDLKVSRPINRLLVTTSAQPQWDQLLPLLAPRSVIFPVSIAGGDFSIPYLPFILNGHRVQGTVVAPRNVHQKMLEFAALNKVEPIIEKFPMNKEGVEEALDKLADGKMRYRGVLVVQ